MKKTLYLLLFISAIGHAQIEKTIQKDIVKLANIINAQNVQDFYDFYVDTKDLKKLFAASNETDYNKIKFRYGQHLSIPPKELFAEFTKKIRKNSKYPTLKPYVVFYEKAAMDVEKRTKITIFLKDENGSLFSMELKSKKIDNEIFYAFREQMEKLQQKGIDNFKKNIQPLLSNNTSELTIITF